ncbi:UPF0728 protein C10orf53 homolog [Coccinella septempunctata]|uniref:UPF0728 protein C10orf53 homolog n=1 Tax=Coccinella septempunctata TaxID=41139 RepID=UPI001D063DCE|nr:UPF0728 protein C10orf53 homolog [Coccinella septempunctata]
MSLIIYYGPYETNGLIKHKADRLHGLLSELSRLSFHIELIPTKHLERLTIEMRNREIFRCNIKYLKYNMDYEDDPMAQKIVAAVQEAHSRIYNESNIPRYFVNKWGMRGVQNIQRGLTPKDILAPSIELISEIRDPKEHRRRV